MASLFRDTKLQLVKTVSVDSTMSGYTEIAKIPKNSRILGFIVNGAPVASATISLGNSSSANEYVNAYSLASGYANFVNDVDSTALGTVTTSDSSVYAIVSATSGTWQVSILFSATY
jgi:hypothetical protein